MSITDIRKKLKFMSFGTGTAITIIGVIAYSVFAQSIGAAIVVGGVVVAFLPYSLYVYFENKRISDMEKNFPNFLKDISEAKKSGIPLPKAFRDAVKRDYGSLNKEIKKVSTQLSWDVPFPEVITRFMERMGASKLIQRSLAIILQAHKSGGDVADIMDSIAQDAMTIKDAEEERQVTLHQQILVIYAIYFLFVLIVIILYKVLSPLTALGASTGGILGEATNFCMVGAVKPLCSLCPALNLGSATDMFCYYKVIFLFMLLIQGIFNGLVAGEIAENRLSAGVMHFLLMVPIGLLAYMIFV